MYLSKLFQKEESSLKIPESIGPCSSCWTHWILNLSYFVINKKFMKQNLSLYFNPLAYNNESLSFKMRK